MAYLVTSGWYYSFNDERGKQILFAGGWEDAVNYAEEAAAREIETQILAGVPFTNEENLDDIISKNVTVQYLTDNKPSIFISVLFHYQGVPQIPWSTVWFKVAPSRMKMKTFLNIP